MAQVTMIETTYYKYSTAKRIKSFVLVLIYPTNGLNTLKPCDKTQYSVVS